MKKIALIGAGQLGSRHLQGLAKSDLEISVEVVEPFDESRNISKQRFEEISANKNIKKIDFLANISQLSDELDLVIIATNADVRYKVVKELLENKKADAIISVCELDHSPLWSNTLPEDGSLKGFLKKEVLDKRSQDLEKYYRLNGAIYICRIEKFLDEQSFFLRDNIFSYIMHRENSIDIDEELDFKIAKILKENVNE